MTLYGAVIIRQCRSKPWMSGLCGASNLHLIILVIGGTQ
jgi:hypothetical protein